jgi:hypothetical protein
MVFFRSVRVVRQRFIAAGNQYARNVTGVGMIYDFGRGYVDAWNSGNSVVDSLNNVMAHRVLSDPLLGPILRGVAAYNRGDTRGVGREVGGLVTDGAAFLATWGATRYCARAGPRPLSRPSGYTRMQDHIPHLDNPATAATNRLTPQQAFALQENLQAIGSQTVPGVRASIQRGNVNATQSLQNQLNLPRFRFIDQVPGGRAAIDAILQEFPNLRFPH